MAKDIYVEEGRRMKVNGQTEDVDTVELMQPMVSDTGEVVMQNDLSGAKFDVIVDVVVFIRFRVSLTCTGAKPDPSRTWPSSCATLRTYVPLVQANSKCPSGSV